MPEIKLTDLRDTNKNSLPVIVSASSKKCDDNSLTDMAKSVSDLYEITPLACRRTDDGARSYWKATIPLVRAGMENVLPSLDASIYYSSSNSVIMTLGKDFAKNARRMFADHEGIALDPEDIIVEFKIVNDTDVAVDMVVSGVWVNDLPVGRDPSMIQIPPKSYVVVRFSDVSITVLGLNGVEAVGVYPAIPKK